MAQPSKRWPYHQEIVSLIPGDATAIRGRKSKKAQLASLSGWVGWLPFLPTITQNDATQRRHMLADIADLAVGAFL